MPIQRKKSFLKSTILHVILIGAVTVILTIGVKSPETIVEVISLENISISRGVKKAVHTAVHAIGLPHKEPEAEHEASAPSVETSSNPNPSQEQSSAGSGIPDSVLQQYLGEIRQRIESTKRYPKDARMNGQEGIVGLRIRIAPDGTLLEVEVESPAMFPSLNQAAVSAVKAHQKFPEAPSSGSPRTEPITLHLPIRFVLAP